LQLALEVSDAYRYMTCQFHRAWALLHLGEWRELRVVLRDGLRMAERNGHRLYARGFRIQTAWLLTHVGNFASARALCEQQRPIFLAQGFAPGPTTNPVSRLSIRPVPFVVSALPQALVADPGAPVEILAAAAVPAMNVCDCAVPIRIVCDWSPTPWLPMWMLLLPFVTLHRTTGTTPAGPARVLCVILG
jgi:hypothetical protein